MNDYIAPGSTRARELGCTCPTDQPCIGGFAPMIENDGRALCGESYPWLCADDCLLHGKGDDTIGRLATGLATIDD